MKAIARLKAAITLAKMGADNSLHSFTIEEGQAVLKRVADYEVALDRLARLGNEPMLGNSDGNKIAQQALKGDK